MMLLMVKMICCDKWWYYASIIGSQGLRSGNTEGVNNPQKQK